MRGDGDGGEARDSKRLYVIFFYMQDITMTIVEDGASTFGPRAKIRSSRLETDVTGLE